MKLRSVLVAFPLAVLLCSPGWTQEFRAWESKTAEFKRWLDLVGKNGSRLWMKLDAQSRPHRIYVGEGFYLADVQLQERFVEIFSHYLAGHPEKFMLIDLFDAGTGKPIGEFGWSGFKLY